MSNFPSTSAPPQSVALSVPKGTPLQVALDQEVRVKRVGQPIHGRIVEPVYAFDRVVVPIGSEVTGEGSGQVIRFVAAAEGKEKKKGIKDATSEKTKQAKEQARRQWDNAMKQLKTPGRMHRLKRYLEAQLPVHRQHISAGTVYFAELNAPLDFGTEPMTPEVAASIGGPLPPGCVVHARLITPLTSATTRKGAQSFHPPYWRAAVRRAATRRLRSHSEGPVHRMPTFEPSTT